MEIKQKPTKNFSSNALKKEFIVIHKTLGAYNGAISWMRNPASQVSAHFIVGKEGQIAQLVQTDKVAWHAGRISSPSIRAITVLKKYAWGSYINPNKYSIGIEFEALKADDKYTEKQIEAGIWLIRYIGLKKIISHRDIASDKPDMEDWLEEIFKRLQEPDSSKVDEAIKLLNKATKLLNEAVEVLKG